MEFPCKLERLLIVSNCFQYFSKNGVPRVPTKYELFNEISGLNLSLEAEGNDFLMQVLAVGSAKRYTW